MDDISPSFKLSFIVLISVTFYFIVSVSVAYYISFVFITLSNKVIFHYSVNLLRKVGYNIVGVNITVKFPKNGGTPALW